MESEIKTHTNQNSSEKSKGTRRITLPIDIDIYDEEELIQIQHKLKKQTDNRR